MATQRVALGFYIASRRGFRMQCLRLRYRSLSVCGDLDRCLFRKLPQTDSLRHIA
jgi:hypothetical protein